MSDMHYMDLEAFNGMRIGFFTDSLQYDVMKRFAAQNGFSFESFFFEESNEMSQALAEGRIDGYVDGVLRGNGTKVVATISTDPFFFVTRKDDMEVMAPLNETMPQILLPAIWPTCTTVISTSPRTCPWSSPGPNAGGWPPSPPSAWPTAANRT